MVTIVLVVLELLLPGLGDDHAPFVRLLIPLAAHRRRQDRHLQAHRAGLAQELDLVEQPIQIALAGQRLAIVMHHHRHGANPLAIHDLEELLRLFRALSLLDQLGGHVLDAEPNGPQAALAAERQEVLILENVKLGPLGAEKDRVAKAAAVDLAAGQFGEDLLDRLAVVEEVVVGAEEGIDAGILGDGFHFMA